MVEVRQEIITTPWTEEEDRLLKAGIREGLPLTGNLTATAAGLHRRLRRRPSAIMQRVNALRRLDPEFDRFIRRHVHRVEDGAGAPRADAPANRRPGRKPAAAAAGGPKGAGRAPNPEHVPAPGPEPPTTDEAADRDRERVVASLVAWLEKYAGELPADSGERLTDWLRRHGEAEVVMALADALMRSNELILDRAEAKLRLRTEAEGQVEAAHPTEARPPEVATPPAAARS